MLVVWAGFRNKELQVKPAGLDGKVQDLAEVEEPTE